LGGEVVGVGEIQNGIREIPQLKGKEKKRGNSGENLVNYEKRREERKEASLFGRW